MASSFGQYTSGIAPVQGITEAGSLIAGMQLKAWDTVGKQFSEAIQEYAKQDAYAKMQEAINKSAETKDVHTKIVSQVSNLDPTVPIPDSVSRDYDKYKVTINEYNEQAKKNGGRVESLLDENAFRGVWLKSARAVVTNKKDINEDLRYSLLKQMDIEADKDTELSEDDMLAGEKLMEEDYFSKIAPSETAINLARYSGKIVENETTPTQEVLADFNKRIKLEEIGKEEESLIKRKQELDKIIKEGNYKPNSLATGATALTLGTESVFNNKAALVTAVQLAKAGRGVKDKDITPEYIDALIEASYNNPLLPIANNIASYPTTALTAIFGDNLTEAQNKLIGERLKEFKSKISAQSGVGAEGGRGSNNIKDEVKNIDARLKELNLNKQVAQNPDFNRVTGKVEITPERKLRQDLTNEIVTTEEEAKAFGSNFEMADYIQQQKLERAEKKEATRQYYEQTYGRVPWNFDSLFDERMPAPETMVDPKTGVTFVKKKNGDWDALPVSKPLSVEEQQKEKAFSFGAVGADGNRLRDKNGNYIPVELSKGSGIFASGKIEGNVENAIKVKKSATDGAEVIRMLRNDIIPLFDKSGVTINPQESSKYMAKLGKLKALMRPELIGAGSVSDWEQKELAKGTPNPTSWTSWVTSMGGERGKAEELLKMLEQNLDNLSTQGGFVIQDKGKKVDPATVALEKFNRRK